MLQAVLIAQRVHSISHAQNGFSCQHDAANVLAHEMTLK